MISEKVLTPIEVKMPIFGVDIAWCINEWNQEIAEITGFSKEEAMGTHLIYDYININQQQSVKEMSTRVINGAEIYNYPLTLIKKKEDSLILSIDATPCQNSNDDIIGILFVARNISEKKKEWPLLLNYLPDIILKTRRDGKILNHNQVENGIEKKGRKDNLFEYFDKNEKEEIEKRLNLIFDKKELIEYSIAGIGTGTGTGTDWKTLSFYKKDSKEANQKYYLLRIIPIIKDAVVSYAMVIITDITQQKLQELAIKDTIQLATNIATGDYSADIEPRSDADTLGLALQKMTHTLREVAKVAEGVSDGNFTTSTLTTLN